MSFSKKIGRGSLGKARRTSEGGPGYVGSLTFDDSIAAGEKVWLAAWIKAGDDGKQYFSLVVERPSQPAREMPPKPRNPTSDRAASLMDDEIPF